MAGRELTITPTKRERRKSPAMSFTSDSSSVQPPPMSPTSSVADTTFEPTIDMMVNDFDDEATLNEEEALADQEAHNPEDEIATLREESEMPIEELLAKYSSMPTTSPVATSSFKRSSGSSRRRRATKRQHQETDSAVNAPTSTGADEASNEPITTATGQEAGSSVVQTDDDTMTADDCTTLPAESCNDVDAGHHETPGVLPPEVNKKHRSHLLDLYPGETFANTAQQTLHAMEDLKSFTPLQTLFDEVEEEEEEDESDTESDDARKIIMVGPDYQADIPEGLSQYGDILPYENEDQLIWEPSQVTEREVEDYLAKIQETRALTTSSTDEAAVAVADMAEGEENTTAVTEDAAAIATAATVATANPTTANLDSESVVKDNEQALHLLVQCGYDFKEALRRKRLNVLPLSDTMSSWSEEECQKFEEGIHKFGKDFYQIRQNQVRTRTMRELVQFYYLWKKSERRDQSFALNDTIDHMDVFLNEGGNGNITSNVATAAGVGNSNGNGNGSCSSQASSCSSSNGHSNANVNNEASALDKEAAATVARKSTTKNYSIMTGSQAGGGSGGGGGNASTTSRKRGASFALDNEDNEQDVENVTIDSLS